MTISNPQHTQQLLKILRRRLEILEEQAVMFSSIYAPPHLLMQIEDTRTEIAQHEASLQGHALPATPTHSKTALPTLAVALLPPAVSTPFAEELAIQLRLRGFRVLEATEQTRAAILPQANAALVYLTPALLKNTALLHDYRQRGQEAPFHFTFVLDGVTQKKAQQTLALIGIDQEHYNLGDRQADPAVCARTLLERVLPALVQPYPIEQSLGLDVFTYDNAADFDLSLIHI